MILDTAVLDAARRKLREAEEELARAAEKREEALREYEDVAQTFRAGASTIHLMLDTELRAPEQMPAPPGLVVPPAARLPAFVNRVAPALASAAAPPPSAPPQGAPGFSRAVWELVRALPEEGEVRLETLRESMGLTQSALNMRVMRAKKLGLIESGGWSIYRLTARGRDARGRRLQVVSDE
jgi:hypothetical protein